MKREAIPQTLSSLDVATGTMVGTAPARLGAFDADARTALEQAVLPALRRAPCLVSFSGGRDSSAVLAVAVAVARREGLPLPVPATNVFTRAPHADETAWQERVIAHLGLDDWLRLEHDDELDILGPYAQRLLARHGLLLPCNAHFHLPLLDAAAGGSLLTGIGGDELFGAASRLRPLFSSRPGQAPRDVLRWLADRAPRALRRRLIEARTPVELPWLRPAARLSLQRILTELAVSEPRRLGDRLAWWRGLRHLGEGKRALELAARDGDVRLIHPLLAEPVWAAVGAEARPRGFAGRADGMRRLFGDLLPAAVLVRASKAHFDEALWTDTAREFARGWDGRGIPLDCVNPDALRAHWRGPHPLAQSFTLAQAAWLAGAGACDHVQERLDGQLV